MPPRRQDPALPVPPDAPVAIIGPPSPLVTPSILRQIFLYSTDHTLARCMRTCQNFYHVAAPVLYREIRCPDIDLEKLALGHNRPTRTRTTRAAGPSVNFKRDLLEHIHILELGLHRSHQCQSLGHLPRLHTLRIRPRIWCPRLCSYAIWLYQTVQCLHLTGRDPVNCAWGMIRADKVVMACYSGTLLRKLVEAPHSTSCSATTITMMVSPDADGFRGDTAQEIRKWLEKYRCAHLRIIIAPPTTKDQTREGCGQPFDESADEYESSSLFDDTATYPGKPFRTMVINFCRQVISPQYTTAIYLIHGRRYRDTGGRYARRLLPSPAVVEESIRAAYEGLAQDQIPKVVFKSRKDYIDEGVVDEIDPSELALWRRWEAKRAESTEEAESGVMSGTGEGSRG